MKSILSNFLGIFLAAIYGLFIRFFLDLDIRNNYIYDFTDLFSVTFIWVLPFVIGIFPLLFAPKEQLKSNKFVFLMPSLSVLLFFFFCYMTGVEDIFCLIVIAFPFLFSAGIGGLIFSYFVIKFRQIKGITYSVFLFPFVFGYIENKIPSPLNEFKVESSVIIKSSESDIWENIVRVSPISENEYSKGFFNYAGIPRPLFAELDKDTINATRIGHFEGGLLFKEKVIYWERNKKVSFDIKVKPSKSNETIFEKHILKGNHFNFLDATYELKRIDKNTIELKLSSTYQLKSNINLYGSSWGEILLNDFQSRLLNVIKNRCEK